MNISIPSEENDCADFADHYLLSLVAENHIKYYTSKLSCHHLFLIIVVIFGVVWGVV